MGVAVKLTRLDHTTASFRREASRCTDADAARRMLALALVLEGKSRAEAARLCGMDRQTLRDWVHRYNEAVCRGCTTKLVAVAPSPGFRPNKPTPSLAGCAKARTGRSMAWCVGAGSTWLG